MLMDVDGLLTQAASASADVDHHFSILKFLFTFNVYTSWFELYALASFTNLDQL